MPFRRTSHNLTICKSTYVLNVEREVLREVKGGINKGDVELTLALILETNQHFDGFTHRESYNRN